LGESTRGSGGDGGGSGKRARERAYLLYQISTVGAPRHDTRPTRVGSSWPADSPDDLSIDRLVTGILLRFAPLDYAADLVASSLSFSLIENSFVTFLQNAVQLVVPLCSFVAGHSGPGAGEWLGQNTPNGMVSLGKIQVQHRL